MLILSLIAAVWLLGWLFWSLFALAYSDLPERYGRDVIVVTLLFLWPLSVAGFLWAWWTDQGDPDD